MYDFNYLDAIYGRLCYRYQRVVETGKVMENDSQFAVLRTG